jgi:hypothetical protein
VTPVRRATAVRKLEIRANRASGSLPKRVLSASDIGPGVWTCEFTIPASTTSIYLKGPYVSQGIGQASVGQITFRNLTTLGIVTP